MVVTTPFLAQLADAFSNSEVSVLCSKPNEPVIRHSPHVVQRPIFSPGLRGLWRLLRLRNKYDLVIDLNHSVIWRDLIMIRLLNPKWAASVHKQGRYGVAGLGLPIYRLMPPKEVSDDPRIARKYLHLGEYLGGAQGRPIQYEVLVSEPNQSDGFFACQLVKDRPFWVVNQHGGRPQMCLRDEDIRDAIEELLANDSEHDVIWVSSPTQHQLVVDSHRKWFQKNPRVHVPKPTSDVLGAVSLIKNCSGLVSPDTSLIHFASAFKCPSVVVFTNELALYAQWAPPDGAWSRHLFSEEAKSLRGYDRTDFLLAVKDLARFHSRDSSSEHRSSAG